MTKCDFCPMSKLNENGELICTARALWRCEEAIERMQETLKEIAKNNINREEK